MKSQIVWAALSLFSVACAAESESVDAADGALVTEASCSGIPNIGFAPVFGNSDKEIVRVYSDNVGNDVVARAVTIDLDYMKFGKNVKPSSVVLQRKEANRWIPVSGAASWSNPIANEQSNLIPLPSGMKMRAADAANGRVHVRVELEGGHYCTVDAPLTDGSRASSPRVVSTFMNSLAQKVSATLAHSVPTAGLPTSLQSIAIHGAYWSSSSRLTLTLEILKNGSWTKKKELVSIHGTPSDPKSATKGDDKEFQFDLGNEKLPQGIRSRLIIHRDDDNGHWYDEKHKDITQGAFVFWE